MVLRDRWLDGGIVELLFNDIARSDATKRYRFNVITQREMLRCMEVQGL